jgi:D-alanyl-D-alanine carboxypeptidase
VSGLPHSARSTDELLGSFLDREPYKLLGGKTGFIQEAGYCFGAAAENADGDRVIAVVLGADSKELRFQEVKSLIYWSFDAYEWPETLTRR